MENCVEFLKTGNRKIICRDKEIKMLYSLIGNPKEEILENIFVFGNTGTGKSLVIESLLELLGYKFAIVNCIESYNGKLIFESILSDLSSYQMNLKNGYNVYKKCDNMADFINYIKLEIDDDDDEKPTVIVFDKCERLRDMADNLLPAFMRLKELTGGKICSILISDIVWEKFYPKCGTNDPVKINFSQYSEEDMLELLVLYKPDEYSIQFYKNYVSTFLSTFFRSCRDINELKYTAKINFDKYIEPIKDGKINKNDVYSLWRNISKVFEESLGLIYLRVYENDVDKRSKLCQEIESTKRVVLNLELPFYAKFMLIAAYLASYNPVKEDKKLFVKRSMKKKKSQTVSKKVIKPFTQSGPKEFTLDRMLAIFYAIIDDKVGLPANLLAQISTISQLGLLNTVSDNLETPKYKCRVNYDFIAVVAKTVGFEIRKYLCDFM